MFANWANWSRTAWVFGVVFMVFFLLGLGYLLRRKDSTIARAMVGIAGKPAVSIASLTPHGRASS